MKKRSDSIPALVLGNGVTGLGTIRALRRSGIQTYCLSRDLGFVRYSRCCRTLFTEKGRLPDDGDLLHHLKKLPIERGVLIPCSDLWLQAVAHLMEYDGGLFVGSAPKLSVVQLLTDKGRFSCKLAELGIPHPRTLSLDNGNSLENLDDRCLENSFLKPRNSQVFFREFNVKAMKPGSREEARKKLEQIEALGLSVVLQEFIPGPADRHYFIDGFIDRQGAAKGLFARHRLRIDPPEFGNSSFMQTVALEEVRPAWDSLKRLLDQIGYRGIFSAEFKKDPRDDEFKLLEVNARPWWYIGFAASCGVNVAAMAYYDALGQEVEPDMEYPAGVSCVYPYYDLRACRKSFREGELSAGQWIKSWITARQAMTSLTDPMPTLVCIARQVGTILKRLILG